LLQGKLDQLVDAIGPLQLASCVNVSACFVFSDCDVYFTGYGLHLDFFQLEKNIVYAGGYTTITASEF